jgi:LPXTG-motif cell wall-anchored protein
VASTADETKQQIEGLRSEVTSILNELERRGKHTLTFKGAAGSAGQQLKGKARRTAETNPLALALIGLSVLAALIALVARARRKAQERKRPVAVLKRRARSAADDLGGYLDRARESMPSGFRFRGDQAEAQLKAVKGEPSMIKKLLWAGLSAGSLAVAGLLARRLSAVIWERAMNENPPTAKV